MAKGSVLVACCPYLQTITQEDIRKTEKKKGTDRQDDLRDCAASDESQDFNTKEVDRLF